MKIYIYINIIIITVLHVHCHKTRRFIVIFYQCSLKEKLNQTYNIITRKRNP